MKILNLYSGIGGNRKLWGDGHDITAVEINGEVAEVYGHYFPDDTIIVGDAHQYLLDHYDEYDFIWSSPPCTSHSDLRRMAVHRGQNRAIYPEMSLYQEILLLKYFAPKKCKFVVENVKPYYDPLIPPSIVLHRHLFWTNFAIGRKEFYDQRKHMDITDGSVVYGFDLNGFDIGDKRKLLRNMVMPEVGRHFMERVEDIQSGRKVEQIGLFKDL